MVQSGMLPTVINTFLPLLVLFIAVAYVYFCGDYTSREVVHHNTAFVHPSDRKLIDKHELLEAQLSEEAATRRRIEAHPKSVVLGFGACLDGVTRGVDLLRELHIEPSEHPQDHDVITSREDLAETFHYFFEHGAAAERYVSNRTLFDELVTAVRSFGDHYGTFWRFGGNAPHMGCRIKLEGHDVLLGAHVSKELRDQFAVSLPVAGGLASASTEGSGDDIHIILESISDETWGSDICPRANRLALHSDIHSPYLRGIEEIQEEIGSGAFKPDALVLGAFQMMDGFPFPTEGERLERLERARQLIDAQGPSVKVHVELASFANSQFMRELYDTGMLTRVDSLGMNEQELTTFTDWLGKSSTSDGSLIRASESRPKVRNVLDALRSLWKLIEEVNEKTNSTRQVSRIHVHTLAFQAVLVKTDAWNRTAEAMSKASLIAFKHVCGFNTDDDIDLNKGKVLLYDTFVDSEDEDLAQRRDVLKTRHHNGVVCWDDTRDQESIDKVTMCLSPNIVCTEPVATIAAGDNISGAAIAVQI
ncbi:conserved hypothetical protein [Perkinsus marinus ATCC 50983]|uniref:ADP-dependent glucokinase n=1 Tax=Perkinsus marinus (strain ATCC 50983 / TXsc) TaxID=423536 RepID=C5L8X6_PERM5|nr:conserved hypothetical protein [Perkinsus marinus ATCC 50983]EER06834.1 conserved hypothetical protein [Perkinsus marinus ATCC 50983]|eukprot:XP_002775018.1 conserved hypothetical protein [Perkinsus marinus ATCC 50983]